MLASLDHSTVRVNMLLKGGADPNLVNVGGNTALSLAVGVEKTDFFHCRQEPVEVVNFTAVVRTTRSSIFSKSRIF